jgi:hypothetical protein
MADYFLCQNCFHPCLFYEGQIEECPVCHQEARRPPDSQLRHEITPMQEQVEEMLDTLPPSVDIIKGEF